MSYPQRGHELRLDFHIYSNGKQWFINSIKQTNSGANTIVSGSWGLSTSGLGPGVYVARDQSLLFGNDVSTDSFSGGSNATAYTVTTTITRFFVENTDGAKHYYGEYQVQGCQATTNGCPPSYSETNFYPASDATGYAPGHAGLLGATQAIDNHGISYSVGTNNLETITDLMGNSITSTTNGWQDSISRLIPGTVAGVSLGSSLGNTSSQYSFQNNDLTPGVPIAVGSSDCPSGTTVARSWIVPSVYGGTQPYYLCYKSFSFQTAFDLNTTVFPNWSYEVGDVSSATSGIGPATLLSAIMLPNKTSYTFNYDSYLSLSQVVLPTGATINYTWQNLLFIAGPGTATPITRVIATRTVIPGNGQPNQVWRYQFIGTPVSGTTTESNPSWAIITDPAGNDEEDQLIGTDDSGASVGQVVIRQMFYTGCGIHDNVNHPTCSPSTGKLLKTISNTFQNFGSGGSGLPRPQQLQPTTTTVTWNLTGGGTSVSQTVRTMAPTYSACSYWEPLDQGSTPPQQYNNPTCYSSNQVQTESEYDLGAAKPGPLLKTTTTDYYWQSSSAYITPNLLALPQKVMVAGPNTQTVETDYAYDVSPNPAGALGNLSDVTRHLNTGISPVVRDVYNSQGMLSTRTDQRGYKTTFSYDNTGAFLSSVTYPSTGTVSHIEGYTFDSNTGLILTHTDQNTQVTAYSYKDPSSGTVDPLNRLRQVTYPATYDDLGTSGSTAAAFTKYSYVDTPGSLSVTQQDLQHSTGVSINHLTKFDGLGRSIQTQLESDPLGADIVDTAYDSMGRVQSVSNPYRSKSDLTYALTTYTYDALSRKTGVTEQDHSTQLWTYNGTGVSYSDENGNTWQQVFDALGRLNSVTEPIGTTITYGYNALNKLMTVTQRGSSGETARAQRSFTYDSLSRLILANNPETGWTCYGSTGGALPSATNCTPDYDGNDNLIAKTDARGVTTTFVYDSLNRLISKSYSGQTTAASAIASITPSSCWQYDTAALGKPLLGAQWTQSGSCPASPPTGALSQTTITNYDARGRISSSVQCVLTRCSSPFTGLPTYQYDLTGNLTRQSNGVGTISLSSQYDGGSHLQTITSTVNDTTHPPLLFSAPSYNPAGELSGVSYGNNLNRARTYDTHFRVTSETDVQGKSQAPGAATSAAVITITGSEQSK